MSLGDLVAGELIRGETGQGRGRFRTARSGEVVDFHRLSGADVERLGAKATLDAMPVGGRCRLQSSRVS
ncbi:MAG: hypothetical protein R3F31_22920 [Verrucomicrobiales bacterium]